MLLWVAWRMWRDLHHEGESFGSEEILGDEHAGLRSAKTFGRAVWAVAIADVSMSLDNVLAVAGAAREHPGILIVGLILSVALMGIAANVIARYIERYRWIAYVGLVVILYVAAQDDLGRLASTSPRWRCRCSADAGRGRDSLDHLRIVERAAARGGGDCPDAAGPRRMTRRGC